MKITINRAGGICRICGRPLEIGGLGANYSNSIGVQRGHVECVNAWRARCLSEYHKEAARRAARGE